MSFLSIEEIHNMAKTEIIEVDVPTIGKIKVKRLNSVDLLRNAQYMRKLVEDKDPSSDYKIRFAIMAGALCTGEGSPMFESPEACEAALKLIPYEKLTLIYNACVEGVNDLNDGAIIERAKKSVAAQPSSSTAS